MKKIRVIVVEDHAVVRAGLRLLLASQADIEVAGEAWEAAGALELARRLKPDVVLLDLSMPGEGGLPAIERFGEAAPNARVLVLTMHEEPEYLRAALAAGAAGYIVKRSADDELIAAVRAVAGGKRYVDQSLGELLIEELVLDRKGKAAAGGPQKLSPRESEVLALIAYGHTNQRIGERLSLSVKTVETYRSRLLHKLALRTRADLVRYAIAHGLLAEKSDSRMK